MRIPRVLKYCFKSVTIKFNRGDIYLNCKLRYTLPLDTAPGISKTPSPSALRDLGELLESGDSSDVTLKVKDQTFAAHKLILGARSPVFKGMFSHDMLENRTKEVVVDECEPEVFKQLLLYLYTDSCGEIEQPLQLYLLADRYILPDLKDICKEAFYALLTPENVEDMSAEAVLHGARALQSKATEFICDNGPVVKRALLKNKSQ